MKTKNPYWFCLRLLGLIAVAFVAKKAFAADFPPIVHLLATDPEAAEAGQDTATFTVFRIGPTNESLTIRYEVGGTAANGLDYAALGGIITIPAGAWTAPITLTPVDDSLIEGTETVIVGLRQPLVWPPPYLVAWPSVALATIEDNDLPPTNHPPVVRIANPPDGSVFLGPLDLRLVANATDFDGRVRSVEFFDGTNSLGFGAPRLPYPRPVSLEAEALDLSIESDPVLYPDLEADILRDPTIIPPTVFTLVWSNVPSGPHLLTAVATDNLGASSRSEPVHIRVLDVPPQPVVNVRATDPVATEPGPTADRLDTATFAIYRTGPTELPLTVFYRLGGTASNGVDYRELPLSVTIPRGASKAEVVVAPLDDNLVEGPEGVVLTIVPPVCIAIFPPPPDCYLVGRYDTARAVINDNDPRNLPPVVEIVRPLDGSVFLAPADIEIVAQARDFDGRVVTVEFFEGDTSLGIVTNTPGTTVSNRPPFAIKWPDVPAGSYVLTAEATDDDGAKSRARPVEIKVADRSDPVVVNIVATDPIASEISPIPEGDWATFAVTRTGPTNRALTVFYELGGTASNGTDYHELPGYVIIPAGSRGANFYVVPIDDRLVEGAETVIAKLKPIDCRWAELSLSPLPLGCYVVGPSNTATAVIRDDDVASSNQPPKVAIVRPESNAIFEAPADIVLVAEAKDADGFVRTVEFFEGSHSLGVVSNSVSASSLGSTFPSVEQLFRLEWNDVPPGAYELTAKATDNKGASSVSAPVRIRVIETHRIPVVTIEAVDPIASEGDWIWDPIVVRDPAVVGGTTTIDTPVFIGPPIIDLPNVAVFAVKRDSGTNVPLTVYYSLGGTASNGEDYRKLDGKVTIPAGARGARIIVDPIDDKLVEGTESVVASLDPYACPRIIPPPPDCYIVGDPDKAVAYIRDNDFNNQLPKVEIVSPTNGQIFIASADIEIDVRTLDPDGYVTQVEFFEGTNSIGKDIRIFIRPPPPGEEQKFSIVWSNVPPNRYLLTAVATDSTGGTSRSAPVGIRVVPRCPLPVVTLQAVDKTAAEQDPRLDSLPDTALFRVSRTCQTNDDLLVRYAIGGTASNGEDYRKLEGTVVIPAGAWSADILIDPIDDERIEGTETVELKLIQPPCLTADPVNDDPVRIALLGLLPNGCYLVGSPNHDTAYIRDNENFPPRVAIVRPQDGDVFKKDADIPIVVQAVDPDGWVSRVDFYADNRLIGSQEIVFIVAPPPGQLQTFSMIWSNAPTGRHVLTARATDDRGTAGESAPVNINVLDTSPLPPVVTIFATDPIAREGMPPNTAAFRIRRRGETNFPLTVHFTIRGTASNGVDYLSLPDTVTIPAGRRTARVLVIPIDDRQDERIETVVLRLQPAALYNVGRPGVAAALILDNDCPAPDTGSLADRLFNLRRDWPSGACYRIDVSGNLRDWESLEDNLVTDDALHFIDPEAPDLGARFYRIVPVLDVEFYDED